MEYVEALMKLDALETLRRGGASDMAAFDSTHASLFLTKAHNEKELNKVKGKLSNIEVMKQIPIGGRWTRGSQGYNKGLTMLKERKLTRYVLCCE